VSVRRYRPEDRDSVRRVCIETGLKGHLTSLFEDTELFADLWLDPYLRGEPEACWVAEVDGEVVGYLVGSQRPGFKRRSVRHLAGPLAKLAWRLLRGRYRHHPPSERFARWMLTRSWREAPRSPTGWPSFHFNVSESARGARALGDELIAAFCDDARASGHSHFFIQVFASQRDRPLPFYVRVGFEIFDVRPTTVLPYPAVLATLVRPVPAEHAWSRHKALPPLPVYLHGSTEAWADQAWPADQQVGRETGIHIWAPASYPASAAMVARVVQQVRRGVLAGTTPGGLTFEVSDTANPPDAVLRRADLIWLPDDL